MVYHEFTKHIMSDVKVYWQLHQRCVVKGDDGVCTKEQDAADVNVITAVNHIMHVSGRASCGGMQSCGFVFASIDSWLFALQSAKTRNRIQRIKLLLETLSPHQSATAAVSCWRLRYSGYNTYTCCTLGT